jgi:hypothetical protein
VVKEVSEKGAENKDMIIYCPCAPDAQGESKQAMPLGLPRSILNQEWEDCFFGAQELLKGRNCCVRKVVLQSNILFKIE